MLGKGQGIARPLASQIGQVHRVLQCHVAMLVDQAIDLIGDVDLALAERVAFNARARVLVLRPPPGPGHVEHVREHALEPVGGGGCVFRPLQQQIDVLGLDGIQRGRRRVAEEGAQLLQITQLGGLRGLGFEGDDLCLVFVRQLCEVLGNGPGRHGREFKPFLHCHSVIAAERDLFARLGAGVEVVVGCAGLLCASPEVGHCFNHG